ncbi:M23 family metallopeptidase [Sphingorhabdus lutea]|nr:M23 family metallopeptidase [Sphingorhabdus lutea]
MTSTAHANSAASASDSFRVDTNKKNETALGKSSSEFRGLFNKFETGDDSATAQVFIPSINPVESMNMTSQYGYRTDPFRGRRANHKGLDIAGPIGTPIYATADGIVGRARWVNGYGKYIELNHGNAIQTRYGHMSALNVSENERVTKGQIIGFMGSTGRSTGSHLHYEVRIAGEPVNPTAFLAASNYGLASVKDDANKGEGGPE